MIISDTSSVSNLFQIERIDLLKSLYGKITITPAVQRELYALEEQKEIDDLKWIKVVAPKDQKRVMKLLDELDLGEAESIALAIERKAKYLIIDEYRGRLIAEQYGVKIVGILGILIQAKQDGLIDSVKDEVQKLRQVGFRLNQRLVDGVLKRLGEI
jgi:predicted nucleic acid-binding protein